MDELYDGDFTWLYDSSKISGATDIGIPDGPTEEGTRGLLKAHDSKLNTLSLGFRGNHAPPT
jgi:hypothetical protein